MKTNHTPGPWVISPREREKIESGAVGIDIDSKVSVMNLATVWTSDNPDDEGEYNAKLIASAPEMLEQLQSIVDGTAFDKETGLIWKHRVEKIAELLEKITE